MKPTPSSRRPISEHEQKIYTPPPSLKLTPEELRAVERNLINQLRRAKPFPLWSLSNILIDRKKELQKRSLPVLRQSIGVTVLALLLGGQQQQLPSLAGG